MTLIGVALIGFLLLAIFGARAMRNVLKRVSILLGILLGAIVLFLLIVWQIAPPEHVASVTPPVYTPEQLAQAAIVDQWGIGIAWGFGGLIGLLYLMMIVRSCLAVKAHHAEQQRGARMRVERALANNLPVRERSRLGYS